MKLESSFDHVWFAREHIEKIVKLTGAGIRCPDLTSLKELPKKYSVWIRGSMDGVYAAGVLLTVSYQLHLHQVQQFQVLCTTNLLINLKSCSTTNLPLLGSLTFAANVSYNP